MSSRRGAVDRARARTERPVIDIVSSADARTAHMTPAGSKRNYGRAKDSCVPQSFLTPSNCNMPLPAGFGFGLVDA
jgi:hypothetical protein